MSKPVDGQRVPRSYRDYVVFTARAPANIVMAVVYLGIVAACFALDHPVAGGVILVCAVAIWLRPAYYLGTKLRERR